MSNPETAVVQKKVSSSSQVSSASSYTSSSTVQKTTYSTKTVSQAVKSSKNSSITVRSNTDTSFLDTMGKRLGIDFDKHLMDLESKADDQMQKLKEEFHIMNLQKSGSGSEVVKIDDNSLSQYLDEGKNALKLNLDVHEFKSETVSVKCSGNKIEVHAQKTAKKGEDESNEEYSRTYELPNRVDADKVTSQFFKDGVLTVELPMAAIEGAKEVKE
nr:small heat shock protein [Naineris dendritica]